MKFIKYQSQPFPLLTFNCKNTAKTMFSVCCHVAENAYFDTSKK